MDCNSCGVLCKCKVEKFKAPKTRAQILVAMSKNVQTQYALQAVIREAQKDGWYEGVKTFGDLLKALKVAHTRMESYARRMK